MRVSLIFSFASGPILAAALSVLTIPLVSWFYSVEDVGRLSLLRVCIPFVVALASFGIHQAYVREYHEVENKAQVLKVALFPSAMFLIALCFILYLLKISPSRLLFEIQSHYILDLLIYLLAISSLIIHHVIHVLRMQERGWAYSAAQLAPKLLFVVLIMLGSYLNFDSGAHTLLSFHSLSIVLSCAFFLWAVRHEIGGAVYAAFDRELAARMFRFSVPLMVSGILYGALTASDRFFLKSFSSLYELGLYGMASSIAGGVAVFSTIFAGLWHPLVYKWQKTGTSNDRILGVIEAIFLCVVALWSIIGIVSELFLYLLPEEYAPVKYLLVACASAPLLHMLSEATVVGVGITRKTQHGLYITLLALIVNLLLNYALVPPLGAKGAAISGALSYFIFFVMRTEVSARIWEDFPRMKMYSLLAIYVCVTSFYVLAPEFQSLMRVTWLLLLIICGCVYYKTTLLLMRSLINALSKGRLC